MTKIIFTRQDPAEETYQERPNSWEYLDETKKQIVFPLISMDLHEAFNTDKKIMKDFLQEGFSKEMGEIYVVRDIDLKIIFNEEYSRQLEEFSAPRILEENLYRRFFLNYLKLYGGVKDMAKNINSRAYVVQNKETKEFIKIKHECNDTYHPDNIKDFVEALYMKRTDKYHKPNIDEILNSDILDKNENIVKHINFVLFLKDKDNYYVVLPEYYEDNKYKSYKIGKTGNAKEVYLSMKDIDKLEGVITKNEIKDCQKIVTSIIPDELIINIDHLFEYYGYALSNGPDGYIEIQKIDDMGLFETDEDALEQCKKDMNVNKIPFAISCMEDLEIEEEKKNKKKQSMFPFLKR